MTLHDGVKSIDRLQELLFHCLKVTQGQILTDLGAKILLYVPSIPGTTAVSQWHRVAYLGHIDDVASQMTYAGRQVDKTKWARPRAKTLTLSRSLS